jgi:D-arginine dehydrogenase
MSAITADILVIGAGIAGASAAAELQGEARVILLEREAMPGTHSTGRSAANWEPTFGTPLIRRLTLATGPFLKSPPDGFADVRLVEPRGGLMVARAGEDRLVEEAIAAGNRRIDAVEAKRLIPLLRTQGFEHFLLDDTLHDVDVDALLGGFLRAFRRRGGTLVTRAEARRIERTGGAWTVETGSTNYSAPILVDAAGAWADEVAALAGLPRLGLKPKLRSAAIIPAPPGQDIARWPQLGSVDEAFYCKPMAGRLMLSPCEATPVEPHDAASDDLKLAEAVEAYQATLEHEVTRMERSWGGLRTFSPDGDPAVGFDARGRGFFWLAGQGGYGIQTSAAMARVAAALVLGRPVPGDIAAHGVTAAALDPARLGTR